MKNNSKKNEKLARKNSKLKKKLAALKEELRAKQDRINELECEEPRQKKSRQFATEYASDNGSDNETDPKEASKAPDVIAEDIKAENAETVDDQTEDDETEDAETEDVFEDKSEVTDEQLDNVMEHNNKLVAVLKNTLEMQAYLFDKLLSYIF